MTKVFFLNKLKKDVKPSDYEKWVKERDYPVARNVKAIKAYDVYKINGAFWGDQTYDYIEVIDVTDVESYGKAAETPEVKKLLEEWQEYIAECIPVHGEPV
tara:strand:- start:303 stop:605 length:303 start_codon:yes stop_codon:yes gene_type:complete